MAMVTANLVVAARHRGIRRENTPGQHGDRNQGNKHIAEHLHSDKPQFEPAYRPAISDGPDTAQLTAPDADPG